ncbi:MAG: hypothetical protein A3B47_03365 [Candidatus Levybacteria bacterium RIFCSPLOWO2_01_FULL_39_24]|nr:MAG: hypothetical protein A2800_02655 [Candidatus Levybacteria bacterium RIFCSPHIGHO2_01_FULL_40_16]OGH28224.1 MAG: hypothetical protein A3E12_00625 [Candidatus Levybacteria bacterium RIFCSPHIGHO2_12_FULL_39_9]OGH46659.1 MAG: hypothetical protein A3B47_03365 [Candidatus Levybacteria bacterium RIFCSPLOWO2_01_FULL_39_24]
MAKEEEKVVVAKTVDIGGVEYKRPLTLKSVRKIVKNARSGQIKKADAEFPPTVEVFKIVGEKVLYNKVSRAENGRLRYAPLHITAEDWVGGPIKSLLRKYPSEVKAK